MSANRGVAVLLLSCLTSSACLASQTPSMVSLDSRAAVGLSSAVPAVDAAAAVDAMELSTFFAALAPYGHWVLRGGLGWFWVPFGVTADWRPYTLGHWAMTDSGKSWVSDEPFGWATYHYGRWNSDREYGWVWIPGVEWAPAWVSWRAGDGYVGWAPLPPDLPDSDPFESAAEQPPDRYCFVPETDVLAPIIVNVLVPPARNVTIIRKTISVVTVVNNRVVNPGPPPRFVGVGTLIIPKPYTVGGTRSRNPPATSGSRPVAVRPHVPPSDPPRPAPEPPSPANRPTVAGAPFRSPVTVAEPQPPAPAPAPPALGSNTVQRRDEDDERGTQRQAEVQAQQRDAQVKAEAEARQREARVREEQQAELRAQEQRGEQQRDERRQIEQRAEQQREQERQAAAQAEEQRQRQAEQRLEQQREQERQAAAQAEQQRQALQAQQQREEQRQAEQRAEQQRAQERQAAAQAEQERQAEQQRQEEARRQEEQKQHANSPPPGR